MGSVREQVGRLEDAMADLARTVKQAEAERARWSAEADRRAAEADRRAAEAERQRTEMNRKWGELSNKMGTLAEDIVAPGLPEIFRKQFGVEPTEFSAQRVRLAHRRDPGRRREFDYVGRAGRFMLVNETKSALKPGDITGFVAALRDIRSYLQDAEGREVVGCLAAFSVDPSLVAAGERHGLIMIGLGTGLLRVLNTPDFVPRRY